MNKKHIAKKALKFTGKALKVSLSILGHALEKSAKDNEYEPTLEESMRGEKLPFSDEYFIPSKDSRK